MKDGVHDIPLLDYLNDPAVNQSSLKQLLRSPAHFRHYVDNPPESTHAQIIGTAFHTILLQPELSDSAYWIRPETYEDKKGGVKKWSGNAAACQEWLAAHADRPVLRQSEHESIITMRMYTQQHRGAALALGEGSSEQSLFATDPETGVVIKSRADRLSGNAFVEVKTCEDASEAGFARAVLSHGYHIQAAFGLHIARLLGLGKETWVFVAVEKEPPYCVATWQLKDADLATGESIFRRLLRRYRKCSEENSWPGYSENIEYLSLPRWAASSEQNAVLLEDSPPLPALEVQ